MKEYRQETEVLSKLLVEILPIVKSQFNLEEYHTRDFKTPNSSKLKEDLLSKIRLIKSSKGFSTASSEEDLKKLKIKKYEIRLKKDKKLIDSLRSEGVKMENKIIQLRKDKETTTKIIQNLQSEISDLRRYNSTLVKKLQSDSQPETGILQVIF